MSAAQITEKDTLRALVLDAIHPCQYTSPYDVMDDILSRIEQRDERRFLREALVPYVSSLMGQVRREAFQASFPANESDLAKERPEAPAEPGVGTVSPTSLPSGHSPKRELRLKEWHAWLDSSIPDGRGGHVRVGDATADVMEYHAKLRRGQASALLVEASRYDRVATLMRRHGVTHVGDLAPNVAL